MRCRSRGLDVDSLERQPQTCHLDQAPRTDPQLTSPPGCRSTGRRRSWLGRWRRPRTAAAQGACGLAASRTCRGRRCCRCQCRWRRPAICAAPVQRAQAGRRAASGITEAARTPPPPRAVGGSAVAGTAARATKGEPASQPSPSASGASTPRLVVKYTNALLADAQELAAARGVQVDVDCGVQVLIDADLAAASDAQHPLLTAPPPHDDPGRGQVLSYQASSQGHQHDVPCDQHERQQRRRQQPATLQTGLPSRAPTNLTGPAAASHTGRPHGRIAGRAGPRGVPASLGRPSRCLL